MLDYRIRYGDNLSKKKQIQEAYLGNNVLIIRHVAPAILPWTRPWSRPRVSCVRRKWRRQRRRRRESPAGCWRTRVRGHSPGPAPRHWLHLLPLALSRTQRSAHRHLHRVIYNTVYNWLQNGVSAFDGKVVLSVCAHWADWREWSWGVILYSHLPCCVPVEKLTAVSHASLLVCPARLRLNVRYINTSKG